MEALDIKRNLEDRGIDMKKYANPLAVIPHR
jgi:hypothetical protein